MAMAKLRENKDQKLDRAAQWIQQALNLEKAHDKWVAEATRLVIEGRKLVKPNDAVVLPQTRLVVSSNSLREATNGDKKYGGKRRADDCRSGFLRRERGRGNPLTPDPLRGPYYRNERGSLVGLTFSSDLGNRWWVNFKKECEEVVMLCDSKENTVRVVTLPRSFFEQYQRHFRAGEDGLVQITLRMRDGRFYAQVPDHGQVDVTDYSDPEPLVCERRKEPEYA